MSGRASTYDIETVWVRGYVLQEPFEQALRQLESQELSKSRDRPQIPLNFRCIDFVITMPYLFLDDQPGVEPRKEVSMATAMDRLRADTTITMRLPVQTRELIDRAAATVDKSRTEFVLESARQRAIDVLLDQRVFHLDTEAGEAFAQLLDNPPQPVEALRSLMASKSPWE